MKVTMKDIANKLGISINAVSIALNDKPGVKYLYFNAKLLCRYRTLLFDCFTVNR